MSSPNDMNEFEKHASNEVYVSGLWEQIEQLSEASSKCEGRGGLVRNIHCGYTIYCVSCHFKFSHSKLLWSLKVNGV